MTAARAGCLQGVRLRIAAWRALNGGHGAFELIPQAPDLRSLESIEQLIAEIEAAAFDFEASGTPLGLICLDTMSKSAPGADQNSSADMGTVMANLAAISNQFGVMVMVVAHTPKDEARGIAGWYGQFAGADVVIMTSRDHDDPNLRTATLTKVKNGLEGNAMAFRLEVITLGVDDDGDPITSCVVAFEEGAPAKASKRRKPLPRLTPPCIIALKAIQHVRDQGDEVTIPAAPGTGVNPGGVSIKTAQDYAFKSGFSVEGEKPNTVIKRWGRTLETLVTLEQIQRRDDLVWLVGRSDKTDIP